MLSNVAAVAGSTTLQEASATAMILDHSENYTAIKIFSSHLSEEERDEPTSSSVLPGPHLPEDEAGVVQREAAHGSEDDPGI